MKSHGTITCKSPNIFKYKFIFVVVRRNYSNRANFIRISPDAPPSQVKELFFRQGRHRVNLSYFLLI